MLAAYLTYPKTLKRLTILFYLLAFIILLGCKHPQTIEENPDNWLYTKGNKIYTSEGRIWQGKGANLHDTRSCNACTWFAPDVDEVKRRINTLIEGWGATFLRLCLESYEQSGGRTHWQNLLKDEVYLENIKQIVDHIGTKPGVMVLLSLWHDPSFSNLGWPTQKTIETWGKLVRLFINDHHVIFGIVNEPQYNYDGSLNQQCWEKINNTVAAIRKIEDNLGNHRHLIAVQGLGGWARFLNYYISHPIAAGGGENIIYETHVYNPKSDFNSLVTKPARTLPVIIGEFGPTHGGSMTLQDCRTLTNLADRLQIPYLAWTFHMRCPPNLLIDYSNGGCGRGMPLEPTAWGKLLQEFLK